MIVIHVVEPGRHLSFQAPPSGCHLLERAFKLGHAFLNRGHRASFLGVSPGASAGSPSVFFRRNPITYSKGLMTNWCG